MELRDSAIIIAKENTNDVILCVRRVQHKKISRETLRFVYKSEAIEKDALSTFYMRPVQGRRKRQVRGHDVSKGTLHPLLIEVTPQLISIINNNNNNE